ncbi:hypothetical protein [uncultured Eubacterium sp.]|uniref:hypothetical protein n=1 Tax=uncultured Eubacterium sp. TaxID=165185 RepID=UPI0025EF1AF6|nr:hypothetical protein [uncultured Eubacterium sp.]
MTNREKFAEQILNIVCTGTSVAVNKTTMEPMLCQLGACKDCYFNTKGPTPNCCYEFTIWAKEEYSEPPIDWSKVPVDTPIMVKDAENAIWHKGHFARVIANKVCAWVNGKTSWTTNTVVQWNYAKLAEESETE